MGAFSGFVSGLTGGGMQKKQQQSPLGIAPPGQAPQQQVQPVNLGQPAPTPQTAAVQPVNLGQPINTQSGLPHSGFNGLVPHLENYFQNHQAKANDAAAQTHVQALQDPHLTPEQRQYHISNLQQIYANRPDVLKQMGIPVPGAYNVPQISAAQPAVPVAPKQ